MAFPIAAVRARFPALGITDGGRPRAYLDAPGGTQVCAGAIEAMAAHLAGGTANAGGAFATSAEVDRLSAEAHAAAADLLNALPEEIAFGANMTSLTFAVSRALARDWRADDELVVTRLDHDANVAPWLAAAQDRGMRVRWLDFDPDTGRLRLDELPGLLSDRTRFVAVGGASNALGTVNDLTAIIAAVRSKTSALIYVDAVQLAPHLPVDVAALGCDLLVCSPYKVFGPHLGVLWCRKDLADATEAYKVRPADTCGAVRFETGTPSFEALAGFTATIDYLAWLGAEVSPAALSRRERVVAALDAATAYERQLGERLLAGLARLNSVRLFGAPTMSGRVPTFSFTIAGHSPDTVVDHLAEGASSPGRGISMRSSPSPVSGSRMRVGWSASDYVTTTASTRWIACSRRWRSLPTDGRAPRAAGDPYGNRTRVSAVKGPRPGPLDEGAVSGWGRA